MRELMRYLDIAFDAARAADPAAALARDWQAADPVSPHEINAWYRQAEGYLYDLAAWHESPGRQAWTAELVRYARQYQIRSILDYGAGCGDDGLALIAAGCSVTFADLDCPASRYLSWRLSARGADAEQIVLQEDTSPASLLGSRRWDLIICIDVLEHLPDAVPVLMDLSSRCSHLAVHVAPRDPLHPMHLPTNDWLADGGVQRILAARDFRRANQGQTEIYRLVR